jgi:hypothetical protein
MECKQVQREHCMTPVLYFAEALEDNAKTPNLNPKYKPDGHHLRAD